MPERYSLNMLYSFTLSRVAEQLHNGSLLGQTSCLLHVLVIDKFDSVPFPRYQIGRQFSVDTA
jgi:hypothetical protein